nr:hypothetical protein KPHV_71830 [Kitasatospora purpeofusca]
MVGEAEAVSAAGAAASAVLVLMAPSMARRRRSAVGRAGTPDRPTPRQPGSPTLVAGPAARP